jgi:cell division protease FtsH
LGHTQQLALQDRHAYPKEYLLSRITILLGGRVAEEIALNQQTTGAEDDFQQAVEIATKMVCKWGMNPEIGPMAYARDSGGFLGDQSSMAHYSDDTARMIDSEVKKLINSCYNQAKEILSEQFNFLNYLADMLLINETLDSEEMEIVYDCSVKKTANKEAAGQPVTNGRSIV